jgi:hypothetical protein
MTASKKSNKAARNIGRLIALSGALFLSPIFTTPAAAATQYVQECTMAGNNFYVSPGNGDLCISAVTGLTKDFSDPAHVIHGKTEYRAIADNAMKNAHNGLRGVAIAAGLPAANIQPGHTFGFSGNIGTFDGYSSLGMSGAVRANDHLSLTGAAGTALDYPGYGGRVGLKVSC